MKRLVFVTVLSVTLSGPVCAHDDRAVPAAPLFGGIVQERDIDLVFGYLREALGAAIEGREAPPPGAIEERANEIGDEMKRRGASAARVFIDVIEKSVREGLREPPREAPRRPALPPSTVYQRI